MKEVPIQKIETEKKKKKIETGKEVLCDQEPE